MIPNAAQGFTQIIEDIGVLDYLLHERQPALPVTEVMRLWEKIRIPRVNLVKDFARWNTDAFTGTAPPSEWARNEQAKTVEVSLKDVKPDSQAKFRSGAFLKWVMDYDAVEEARRYVDARQASRPRL
jgi:salicylate hydroxylase